MEEQMFIKEIKHRLLSLERRKGGEVTTMKARDIRHPQIRNKNYVL